MLDALDDNEKELVRRALIATADGPFFPDWEFQTLFGVDREAVRKTAAAFPLLKVSNEAHVLSVNNSLFMLTTYPIAKTQQLADWGLCDLGQLACVLKKLRTSLGKPTKEFLDHYE